MGLVPTEVKARAWSYIEAAQHGHMQRVFWEAISHQFDQDESVNLLKAQLADAVRDGDVGDTAVLTINLRRQRALSLEDAARYLAKANEKAEPQYEEAVQQEELRKNPHWYNWLSPRRWTIEARQADLEVGATTAHKRAERWRRYATRLQANPSKAA